MFDPKTWKGQIPKVSTSRLSAAFERLLTRPSRRVRDVVACRSSSEVLYFKKTAYNWLAFTPTPPPCFGANGESIEQTQLDSLSVADKRELATLFLLLNGKLVFLFWCIVGDDFHVTKSSFADFPVPHIDKDTAESHRADVDRLAKALERQLKDALSFKLNAGKKVGNYSMALCRSITDQSDSLFAQSLGISEVWNDFELFYAQMVKTDFNGDGEEAE
jgi:hypothetical protein